MLVCKECGGNSFIADFDVKISVSGRIQSMGPIENDLPQEATGAYASLYNIKVATPIVFSKLRWRDARLIECRRCGSRDVSDDISSCPECSNQVGEEDQIVYCRGGKRVVCVYCVNDDWCFSCVENECGFSGRSSSIFSKARQRIKRKTESASKQRPARLRSDSRMERSGGIDRIESSGTPHVRWSDSLRPEMPPAEPDEARTPQPTITFTDDDDSEQGETY